jgi:WD40 repeat protein
MIFIYLLLYSPDGKWLASGSGLYDIYFLHTHKMHEESQYAHIHIYMIFMNFLSYSPDGKRLASCGLYDIHHSY